MDVKFYQCFFLYCHQQTHQFHPKKQNMFIYNEKADICCGELRIQNRFLFVSAIAFIF